VNSRNAESVRGEAVARIAPTAALVVAACALAWIETGSIAASDWLLYAVLAGLLLAVVVAVGGVGRPTGAELGAIGALLALAGWVAISLSWSALPSLARDEALLTAFYAIVLLVPLVTLRSAGDRITAAAAVAAGSGVVAIAASAVLRFGTDQADHYYSGRLSFPISYPNALAAVFLVGFWPAIVLAARRDGSLIGRSFALAAAAATAAAWLLTQSKGGALGIGASAVLLLLLSPLRLRLLAPTLLAAGLTTAASRPLTAPFRASADEQLVEAVRRGGAALLLVTAAAAALGLVYAAADRRIELSRRARRGVGIVTLSLFCVMLLVGTVAFFARVDHPVGFAQDKWRAFKHVPAHENTSTHLLTLGSYRYDLWRVALDEFDRHPLAGIGSRGFGTAYLEHRRTPDTPARAHSLWLDALSELGIVGLILLVASLALPLRAILRRTLAGDVGATAAFGGGAYWLAHASVDWIWTLPACGVPFFLLLGAGGSGGERRRLGRGVAVAAASVTAVVALVAFVPPWLSARLTSRAFTAEQPAGDLRWAKRLDPLSVEPYLAEAALASSPRAATPPLAAAVRKEPRSVELRYDLALAYVRTREWRRARAELLAARRIDRREPRIAEALKNLPSPR